MVAYIFLHMLEVMAFADDADILNGRLNKINSFYARFTQIVTSAEGDVVQEGAGELWMKRPNLFKWHMTSPDESILVSDGTTLWFYNPFVEQVTANWLSNVTDNTPLMLIIRNSATDWHQYNVQQQGDSFLLVPKYDNSNLKQFTIKVTIKGNIEGFTVAEQDGQHSVYKLNNQKNGLLGNDKFYFSLPQGVMLDDQR